MRTSPGRPSRLLETPLLLSSPVKDLPLDSTVDFQLTSVEGEETFRGEVVVAMAGNVWRGGLHDAHLWMVGANAEPVGLGLSASMVELGIAAVL